MTTQHTALPWTFIYDAHSRTMDLKGNNADTLIAEIPALAGIEPSEEHSANLALIVRACNAHEELLAALQAALNDILLLTPLASPQLTDKGIAEVNSHVAIYRAAIAKAKGAQ